MTRKIIRLLSRYLCFLIAALIVGLGMFISFSSGYANTRIPMAFKTGISVVLSGSMEGDREGSLSIGDLIVFRESDSYNTGDVIVYQSANAAVVHRITEINGDSIITKGDANNAEDEAISKSEIKGKVLFSLPCIGYLILGLKSPIGIIAIIAIALLLLELSYRRMNRQNKEETQKIKDEIEKLRNK